MKRIIVLSALRYTDDRLIVSAICREVGRVDFYVPVLRGRRAAVRHTLFQPFAVLDVHWDERTGGTLARPRQATLAYMPASIPFSPQKVAVAQFLCEIFRAVLREEADAGAAFPFVEHCVYTLDALQEGVANFHLLCLLRLTRYVGIAPDFSKASTGGWFDLREGEFTGRQPLHTAYLTPDVARHLTELNALAFDNLPALKLTGTERAALLKGLIDFFRVQIPAFPQPRSLDVLRDVFA